MLHFTQKLKTARFLLAAMIFSCCIYPWRISAQITDTIIMDNTGHDATAWWTVSCGFTDSLNGGGGQFMQCQRWTWSIPNCNEGEQIPHIRFNLPSTPPGYALQKVELQLFFPTGNPFPHSTGNNHMYLQQLTGTWDEATLNWVNKPAYTTVNQVSVPAASSGTQTYTIDMTTIAQQWFNGIDPNYGIRLKVQNPTPYRRATFASSEHPDTSLRPRVIYTYVPTGINIVTNFTDTLICAGSSLDIEVQQPLGGGYTYSWTSDPPGFFSTQPFITVNPTQNTQYTVEVTKGGQTEFATVNVETYNCCNNDLTPYTRFHKSFSGLVNEPHGTLIGGRADLTASGDLLLAGYAKSLSTHDALLTKINPNGNYNWTRAYGLANYDAGLSAFELSSGEYLLVGHTNGTGSGNVLLFVQKVDVTGNNVIWTRIYDQTQYDVATAQVVELPNGDIVIAATAVGSPSMPGQGIAIYHLDNNGFVISTDFKRLTNKGDLLLNDVIVTSDDGFLLCGEASPGLVNDYHGAFLMKFDDMANFMWAQVYRFPSASGFYNLGSTNPAEISVTRAYSVLEDVVHQKYVVAGDASDIYTFNDALVWDVDPLSGALFSVYRMSYSGHESAYQGIAQSKQTGEYLLTGYTRDGGTSTELSLLSRCDHAFNFSLHQAYGTPGVQTTHRGVDVFEYPGSSDYLIHGRAVEPFMPAGTSPQSYAIRTDVNGFNGCELARSPFKTSVTMDEFSETEDVTPYVFNTLFNPIPPYDFCGNLTDLCAPGLFVSADDAEKGLASRRQNQATGTLSLEMEKSDAVVSIAPNPALDHVRLTLDMPRYKHVNLYIVDLNGRVLLEKSIPAQGQHKVDLTGLPGGMYVLSLKNNKTVLKQHKLLIAGH